MILPAGISSACLVCVCKLSLGYFDAWLLEAAASTMEDTADRVCPFSPVASDLLLIAGFRGMCLDHWGEGG